MNDTKYQYDITVEEEAPNIATTGRNFGVGASGKLKDLISIAHSSQGGGASLQRRSSRGGVEYWCASDKKVNGKWPLQKDRNCRYLLHLKPVAGRTNDSDDVFVYKLETHSLTSCRELHRSRKVPLKHLGPEAHSILHGTAIGCSSSVPPVCFNMYNNR